MMTTKEIDLESASVIDLNYIERNFERGNKFTVNVALVDN